MRRFAALLAVLAAIVLAGCDSSSSGGSDQDGGARSASSSADEPVLVRKTTLQLKFTFDAVTRQGSRSGPAATRVPGVDVVATISPIQYLRFLSTTFEGTARVETIGGPRQVECLALWARTVDDATADAAAELSCRLPPQVETAPGLRAEVTITSTPLEDVLVVPNVFIGYDAHADQYFVQIARAAGPVRVPVQVGLTDGVVRVVTGDLAAGDQLVVVAPDANGSGD